LDISESPTSFPAPKRLGLSWEVQCILFNSNYKKM
jgi:hypothetical protein